MSRKKEILIGSLVKCLRSTMRAPNITGRNFVVTAINKKGSETFYQLEIPIWGDLTSPIELTASGLKLLNQFYIEKKPKIYIPPSAKQMSMMRVRTAIGQTHMVIACLNGLGYIIPANMIVLEALLIQMISNVKFLRDQLRCHYYPKTYCWNAKLRIAEKIEVIK